MSIKSKIIGNQIWTAEDVCISHLKSAIAESNGLQVNIEKKNSNYEWINSTVPAFCTYQSNRTTKSYYLYNQVAAEFIYDLLRVNNTGWRLPTITDWITLFHFIDNRNNHDNWNNCIAQNIRGAYCWPNNGTNKIGFNAIPNSTRNEDGSFTSEPFAKWWVYNPSNQNSGLGGIRLYPEDIIAEFGTQNNIGLAIRLVRDIYDIRPENGIQYV